MNYYDLVYAIESRQSVLCVGLDSDVSKLPSGFAAKPASLADFNKAIIDATAEYAVAYKPNLAFYEAYGLEGWKALEETIGYLRNQYPGHLTIADAKRGDIGNTASQYAKGLLQELGFDAITVAPYMGRDSVEPFLLPDKWAVVLALTSNGGADDFQQQRMADGRPLYAHVLERVSQWIPTEQRMFVVGATRPEGLAHVRTLAEDTYFLVPGVGAQGGSVAEVLGAAGWKNRPGVGVLINASRSIQYASNGLDFAAAAAREASALQTQMALWMQTARAWTDAEASADSTPLDVA
jgi:orotidine-5'-phosphate decarboxylase